jgi:hypothetical protein
VYLLAARDSEVVLALKASGVRRSNSGHKVIYGAGRRAEGKCWCKERAEDGGVLLLSSSNVKENIQSEKKNSALSAILSISYLSIIVCVMTLPVCLSAMYGDKPFCRPDTKDAAFLSKIVAAGTAATVMKATRV